MASFIPVSPSGKVRPFVVADAFGVRLRYLALHYINVCP